MVSVSPNYITHDDAKNIKAKAYQKGTIIFAKIGEALRLNRRAMLGCPAVMDNNVMGLIPKTGVVDPDYLFYFMQTVDLGVFSRATAVPSVRKADVMQIAVPLAPLQQQKRIVAEIEKHFSRLDEAVANLKRVKANLKRYKAAVLKVAVEGKLTEEWRKQHPDVEPADKLLERILAERRAKWEEAELAKMKAKGKTLKDDSWKEKYKEPAAPDATNLPQLPGRWAWAKTEQIFWFVTSGSRGWAEYYSETGPLFLRIGNLDHDSISIDFEDLQRVNPPKGTEGMRTRVAPGDILVSITADVGMIAIVPGDIEEAYINQHISLARPVSSLNGNFLAWFLCSKNGQDQFKELQRGATKAGLGLDDIRAVSIPLPPLAEQNAIVEEIDCRLSIADELEAQVDANLKRAERLRQVILKQSFSGRLSSQIELMPAERLSEPVLRVACSGTTSGVK